MTTLQTTLFDLGSARLVLVLALLGVIVSRESQAQIRQPMKVKLNVSPSIVVSRMDADLQVSLTAQLGYMNQLVSRETSGVDSVVLAPGFSIAAYENVSVDVSVETPSQMSNVRDGAGAFRITCGYLNDGTTYFRRSTITNRNNVQFRLRNNDLLKHSMKLNNPRFVAYVFFLINERKEARTYGGPLPVSTVTVEFM